MAKARARLVDRNRLSKRYPFVRAPKRLTWQGTQQIEFELGSITFDNEDQKTFTFEAPFENTTNLSFFAMPRDLSLGGESYSDSRSANVNIYIPNAGISKDAVIIVASAKFTGVVDIFAVRIKDN
jgi:hypothetical protein